MRARLVVLLLVVLLAGALLPANVGAGADSCEPRSVELIGLACYVPGGYEVFLADGSRGFVHGVDMPPADLGAATIPDVRVPPLCVPANEPHMEVLYVQPSDRAFRADAQGVLRDLVNRSNGHLRASAGEFGAKIGYRFSCTTDGFVRVTHVPIAATRDAAFGTVVDQVRAAGYTSSTAKYWIWLDTGTNGGGVGFIRGDDRLTASNANLGAPDYALTYGATGDWGVLVLMHESGHNLGAVQLSAPHTSGGWHCNDGRDIMCYSDGGSKANYTETACPSLTPFDCGHDDYFHPSPPAGNYLATHWNLAHTYNKYFDFSEQPPAMRWLQCGPTPTPVGSDSSCSFGADSPGFGVAYYLAWGDGSPVERWPAGGYTGPGTILTAPHHYAGKGAFLVSVYAEDNGTPPQTSAPLTLTQRVECRYDAARSLGVGIPGMEIENTSARWEYGIPSDCWGEAFTLTFGSPHEFDLCWYAGGTQLSCHRETGQESGTVPHGADRARVLYRTGLFGFYYLKVVEQ